MTARRSAIVGESGYDRRPLDAYWTPAWVTDALLNAVRMRGRVWEPAAGRGDMVRVLERHGYEVEASDIAGAAHGLAGCAALDFLETRALPGCASIVTNPPYKDAENFIRHALRLTAPPTFGMVAMLLRHEYDCAGSRRDLWDFPFSMKLTLTRRPRWSESDRASPRHNFAWFVWDWRSAGGAPVIRWAA